MRIKARLLQAIRAITYCGHSHCGHSQRVAEFPQRVVVSTNQKAAFSNLQRIVKPSQRVLKIWQRVVRSYNALSQYVMSLTLQAIKSIRIAATLWILATRCEMSQYVAVTRCESIFSNALQKSCFLIG